MNFFRDSIWNGLNLMIPAAASLISISLVGRVLTTDDFGIYAYMLRVAATLSFVFISTGMFVFSYYFQRLNRSELPGLFYSVSTVLVMGSLALLAGLLLISRHLAPSDVTSLWVFGVGIGLLVIYVLKGVYSEALNALFDFKLRALAEALRAVVWLGALSLLFLGDAIDKLNAILAIYGSHLVCLVFYHILIKSRLGSFKWSLEQARSSLQQVGRRSKFFVPATTLNFLLTFMLFFFVAKLGGARGLGIFSYSFYISFIFTTVAGAISNTLLPYSAREESERVGVYLWTSNSLLVYAYLALILLVATFAGSIMQLLFDRPLSGFDERMLLVVMTSSFLFKALAGNVGTVLNGIGRTEVCFRVSLVTFLTMAIAAPVLVARFSLLGAAFALLLVYSIQLFLSVRYLSKYGFGIQLYTPGSLLRVCRS